VSHEYVLWVLVVGYAIHVVEEHNLDMVGWVKRNAQVEFRLADFYVVNAALLVGMIATASIGWRLPEVSLAPAALMFINGLFAHAGASLLKRKYSPGVLTGLVLFLPLSLWAYYAAYLDGVLTASAVVWSTILGALSMAYPLILYRLKLVLAQT
jgi:hypothetical protein